MHGDDSDVEIESSHIVANNGLSKGAIYHVGGDVDINNCTISGNSNYALYSEPDEDDVNEADVTITKSTISDNADHGLYFQYHEDVSGTITIADCTIADNSGTYAAGIRVNAPACTVVIQDCNLTGNTTTSEGGAVHLRDYNDALITGCIITGNSGSSDAGGVCLGVSKDEAGGGPTLISECVISDNITDGFGGGIECWNTQLTVENCTIAGNKALRSAAQEDNGGGGIGSLYGLDIINCLIVGNKTNGYGGGVDVNDSGDSLIRNCTIADNFAAEQGGGISIQGSDACDVDLKNSIVWYNSADDGNDQIFNGGGSLVLHIGYTDGQGSGGSGDWQWDPNWDDGDNIDADPCFVSRGSWVDVNEPNTPVEPNDPNAVWADGDYHLKGKQSPCFDTGDPNDPNSSTNETDIDGDDRVMNGRVDMGADEIGCLAYDADEYDDWVAWGKPECWCYRKQCRGDADGQSTLGRPVGVADNTLLVKCFGLLKTDPNFIPWGCICADFNHASILNRPVNIADNNILTTYFGVLEANVPACNEEPIITGPYNFWTN